jgi:hypothetical protein
MAIKIKRTVTFDFDDQKIKAKAMTAKELLHFESARRDIDLTKQDGLIEFHNLLVDLFSQVLIEFELEDEGSDSCLDWSSLSLDEKTQYLELITYDQIYGIYVAYGTASSPTPEDEKK